MNTINQLIYIISRLPGLGQKSSVKIALSLLNSNQLLNELINILNDAKKTLTKCNRCGNIDKEIVCAICMDENKEKILCIVENINDLWSIEKTGFFNGKYHILNGRININEGIYPSTLNIESIKERIINEKFDEIIVATSSTVAGQTTAFYIIDIMNSIISNNNINCKITTLGQGIPFGSEIDYLDDGTIINSFKGRKIAS